MPAMALGTTTIENIVAHDAAALEKDLASIKSDASLALPGVPQIVTRVQQMLSDCDHVAVRYELDTVHGVVQAVDWLRLVDGVIVEVRPHQDPRSIALAADR